MVQIYHKNYLLSHRGAILVSQRPQNARMSTPQDLQSTAQVLKNQLPLLQHRSYPHDRVVTMICDLERSIRILERAKSFLSPGHVSMQGGHEELATLYLQIPVPKTSHERRLDVAALATIIPNMQNSQAKLLMLALKLELEAEERVLSETETSHLS